MYKAKEDPPPRKLKLTIKSDDFHEPTELIIDGSQQFVKVGCHQSFLAEPYSEEVQFMIQRKNGRFYFRDLGLAEDASYKIEIRTTF